MLALFIAKKIYKDGDGKKQVSRPAILISMIGIAIGLAVMIIAVGVVIGFKKEIRNKVIGFGGHVQITNFDSVASFETTPIAPTDSMLQSLYGYPEVEHIQRYSTKPGMIKTDEAFQGMVLKGVGPEFDPTFFAKHLVEGEIPAFSDSVSGNHILISKSLADKLMLKLGDRVNTYYFEKNVRTRPLTIRGIYQTNYSEYDNLFLITDIYTVNRLNNWKPGQISGLELYVDDYSKLYDISYEIAYDTDHHTDHYGSIYFVRNIEQLNPQIFAWLQVLDLNIWVILILMIGVAGFTMISGLLIIILERTNMIGTLKALGANNFTIRKIFLWFSVFLIGKGMIWGNVIGLTFYFLQSRFKLLKLDPTNYYIDAVPVAFDFWIFLLLNISAMVVAVLMLIGPSYLITKINPAASMRYE